MTETETKMTAGGWSVRIRQYGGVWREGLITKALCKGYRVLPGRRFSIRWVALIDLMKVNAIEREAGKQLM